MTHWTFSLTQSRLRNCHLILSTVSSTSITQLETTCINIREQSFSHPGSTIQSFVVNKYPFALNKSVFKWIFTHKLSKLLQYLRLFKPLTLSHQIIHWLSFVFKNTNIFSHHLPNASHTIDRATVLVRCPTSVCELN